MRSKTVLVLIGLAVVLFALPAAQAAGDQSPQSYIVQMLGEPAVAYDGGVSGLAATKPGKGQKIDPNSSKVLKYVDHLTGKHAAAAGKVGGEKFYDYVYSFNGFAARMTEAQAAAMEARKDVVAVTANEVREVDTSSTPAFLGLANADGTPKAGGLWDLLGGVGDKKTTGAGENVILGIVDSGIWPEHPSVSDRDSKGKLVFQQIPGWHGKCTPGEAFNASNCNQKLIGARYYNAGWGGNAAIDELLPFEFNSPRDHNGHGTHTATTAGGNYKVAATGPASVFGSISGMAPRARIAAYKACWSVPGTAGSCQGVDLLAAIDQAVADGVDVINYSISGTRTNFRDPVEIAFLFAADAGVFVAASAGNSGPTTSTVAHPSPWITTVAAGTHNRNGTGSVTLGNGASYSGASVATAVSSAPLIDSTVAGKAGADPTEVSLCFSSADTGTETVLDPAKVSGKIVVCDRGVTARVNKSLAVKEAGGIGMILVNTSASSLNADFHFVPTVHLQNTDRAAIKAYAATTGATAAINQATIVYDAPAPFTASFSSRGPLLAGNGDLLKPDVIAPGVDILAGVAPPDNADRLFDLYSGTSMSSPHVAGLAALLKHLRPNWSPMAIKSALMTSAGDVLDGPNTNPLVIFRQGAGQVRPNSAADPGLVFDSGFNDWLAFICATQPAGLETAICEPLWSAGYSDDASDFNTPSIAIGDLAGNQTVTRTVTNVGTQSETYTASLTGLTGIAVDLPGPMAIAKGEAKSFDVEFTTTTASLNSYVGGQFTLTGDKGHVVRIPVVIRPVALAAPPEVSFETSAGPSSWDVKAGYAGTLTSSIRGLIPATTTAYTVSQDADQNFACGDTEGVFKLDTVIPTGTTHYRVGIYEDAITPTGTDLDLFVCQGSTLVGASADGDSNEEVNFTSGIGGSNIAISVYVHGYSTNGPSAAGTLFEWAVGTADAGNTTLGVTPSSTTIGGSNTVTATFTGLAAGTRYMGVVRYSNGSSTVGSTVLRVDTP